MRFETAVDLLAIDDDFSLAALGRAYRQAVLKHHPDRHGGTREATERFLEVQHAYDLLKRHARDVWEVPTRPLRPIRVPCVAMGRDLVGEVLLDARRVRRHEWVPVVIWAARTCPHCAGAGEVPVGTSFFGRPVHAPCERCDGLGVQGVEKTLRLRTPSLRAGTTLRLRGLGLPDFQGGRGDAILHLG